MCTPLHSAAAAGHGTSLDLLLAAPGVDTESSCASGGTPLHTAALNGQLDALRCLLAAGANVHATDNRGQVRDGTERSETRWDETGRRRRRDELVYNGMVSSVARKKHRGLDGRERW